MAGKSAVLTVKILTDASKASKGIDQASGKFAKLQNGAQKALPAATAIGAGLLVVGTKAVKSASELEQAQGAVDAIYGKSAKAVDAYSKTSVDRLGLSESAYKNYSALVGAALQNAGFSAEKAAGMSDKAMVRAADMAATFGGTTAEAVDAINAAVSRGEFDPLEKYGVALNKTAVNAELAKRGQDKLTGSALKQAEAQATLDLIYKQSSGAAGQFARESDTVAGQQQRAAASFENASAALGQALLPAVAAVTAKLATMALWVSENTTLVLAIASGLATFVGVIFTLNAALKAYQVITTAAQLATKLWNSSLLVLRVRLLAMAAAEKIAAAATIAWNAATKAAAVGMRLLNAAMRANPIGLIVTAITIAIGVLVLLWTKNEGFRNFVIAAWKAIASAAVAAWNWIKSIVASVLNWAKPFLKGFAKVAKAVWKGISAAGRGAWKAIKAIVSTVLKWAKAYIRGYATVVKAVFKVILGAGRLAWKGIKTVVKTVISWLRTAIRGVKTVVTAVWKAMKTVAQAQWRAIKTVIQTVVSWVKSAIRTLREVVNGVWRTIKSVASTAWRGIKTSVKTVLDWIKTAIRGVKTVVNGVWTSIKNAARTAFGAIKTPINAVKDAIDNVIDAAKSLIDWLGKIKVPKLGKLNPFKSVNPTVSGAVTYGTPTLAQYVGAPRPTAARSSGSPITINVNGTLNDADSARAVRRVLRNDARQRGGVHIERRRQQAF